VTALPGTATERVSLVGRIATEVAEPAAVDVDQKARFPKEAVGALKEHRLLSALLPVELGGAGSSLSELCAMCVRLSERCASTAMVFAMHQIQVASILRHASGSGYFRGYLAELADKQLLIASVTSEVGVGGDLRSSIAGIERQGDVCKVEKNATTISYGAEADDLLLTCRRGADAPPNEQVLVLLRKKDFTLERTSGWDTLGMRGTCSPGFRVAATFREEQVVPGSFGDVAAKTMVPFSHLLWASCWLGIAQDAFSRASKFVRGQAKSTPGKVPPTALRLAELQCALEQMRGTLRDHLRHYEDLVKEGDGDGELTSVGNAIRMNDLKVVLSQALPDIVRGALLICGMAGYKNDSPFSLGRHLRDAQSAALMIGNDRILATNASLLLVHKDDTAKGSLPW
jgi:acyl-CoA dehydrogenase